MIRVPKQPIVSYFKMIELLGEHPPESLLEADWVRDSLEESLILANSQLLTVWEKGELKQRRMLKAAKGIYKYLARSSLRPTPFGSFAGVCLGTFAQKDERLILAGGGRKHVTVDTSWITGVINEIEDDEFYLHRANLVFNKNCYLSGDRLKNPYHSNRSKVERLDNVIVRSDIRNTRLMELVREVADDFISFKELHQTIKVSYPDVGNDRITDSIIELIRNEFLFTDYRLNAYAEDPLTDLIVVLEGKGIATPLLKELKEIRDEIRTYCEGNYKPFFIDRIYRRMERVHPSKYYLEPFAMSTFLGQKRHQMGLRPCNESFFAAITFARASLLLFCQFS